jgi:hypothetical protein
MLQHATVACRNALQHWQSAMLFSRIAAESARCSMQQHQQVLTLSSILQHTAACCNALLHMQQYSAASYTTTARHFVCFSNRFSEANTYMVQSMTLSSNYSNVFTAVVGSIFALTAEHQASGFAVWALLRRCFEARSYASSPLQSQVLSIMTSCSQNPSRPSAPPLLQSVILLRPCLPSPRQSSAKVQLPSKAILHSNLWLATLSLACNTVFRFLFAYSLTSRPFFSRPWTQPLSIYSI